MAQRALGWASLETLLWFSRGYHRTLGWTLKPDQVKAYFQKDDLPLLQGTPSGRRTTPDGKNQRLQECLSVVYLPPLKISAIQDGVKVLV